MLNYLFNFDKLFFNDFLFFIPEIYIFIGLNLILSFGVIFKEKPVINVITALSFQLFLLYFILIINNNLVDLILFNNLFISNYFIFYCKLFIVILFLLFLFLINNYFYFENLKTFEYILLLNLVIFGLILLVSVNDFLAFYLTLELQSFSLYILATYKQFSNFSTEAGIKYFILGAISSGLLLFGISLIYGLTGILNFNELEFFLLHNFFNFDLFYIIGLVFAFFLILSGFFFKIGAFPFHSWIVDVYEGVPTLSTAFFSLIPKIAILSLLIRFSFNFLNNIFFNWGIIFIIISIFSTFIGTFGALFQIKIKRLFAYSAIGHVGFLMLGLSLFSINGLNSIIFYIFIYSLLVLNLFSIILVLRKYNYKKLKLITDLISLNKNNLLLVSFLALSLFSIAGIPPLMGFYSKMYIFFSAVEFELFFFILFMLILSMIGAFYYVRLIKLLFFDLNKNYIFLIEPTKEIAYIIVLTGFINILFFCFPNIFFVKICQISINLFI